MSEYLRSQTDLALLDLESGNLNEAYTTLKMKAWTDPSYQSFVNAAAACRAMGDFPDAIRFLEQAIALERLNPVAYFNLANVETDLAEFNSALYLYRTAHSCAERSTLDIRSKQKIHLGLAQALLRERNFIEGWGHWELGRVNISWHVLPGTQIWIPGVSPKSGHVLVVCEGGYGDAFFFSRWLPQVKQRGADKVTLMIWRCLVDWADWSRLGVDHVVAKEDGLDPTGIDHTTSWMSLPADMMRSPDDIPRPLAWASLPGKRIGGPCEHTTPSIGFCWKAGEVGHLRKFRSLPDPSAAQVGDALLKLGGFCVSLNPVCAPCPGWNTLPGTFTWRDTTSMIQTLDLVVSVDTAVAHLAALCGVPTLLLLPANVDWKWGHENEDRWYGPHVRYFRNCNPHYWDVAGIIEAVKGVLSPACTTPK
jgi:hypothetical protein